MNSKEFQRLDEEKKTNNQTNVYAATVMHVHLSCEAERRNTIDGKKDNTAFATLRARYMFLLTFSLAFFVNTHCMLIYYFHYLPLSCYSMN